MLETNTGAPLSKKRRLQHERKQAANSNNVIGKKKFDLLLSDSDAAESAPDKLE